MNESGNKEQKKIVTEVIKVSDQFDIEEIKDCGLDLFLPTMA